MLLAKDILTGNTQSLAKAITLVESKKSEHKKEAFKLLEEILPYTGQSLRIGISGVPGVGKSTFIEQLGSIFISSGHKVAVLAVDPSSPLSGGALMGDRVRMETLSRNKNAFIRPASAGGHLGGVALKTRESILLCEACGFDTIIIETVGVGQSEYSVSNMVDCFVLLVLPHMGDDIQGIKKGILDLIDMLIVHKADGPLLEEAKTMASVYKENFMKDISVTHHSSLSQKDIGNILEHIQQFRNNCTEKRREQRRQWMIDLTKEFLLDRFYDKRDGEELFIKLKEDVYQGKISPILAAERIVDDFARFY